jgi:hypothetical protein
MIQAVMIDARTGLVATAQGRTQADARADCLAAHGLTNAQAPDLLWVYLAPPRTPAPCRHKFRTFEGLRCCRCGHTTGGSTL